MTNCWINFRLHSTATSRNSYFLTHPIEFLLYFALVLLNDLNIILHKETGGNVRNFSVNMVRNRVRNYDLILY